MKTLLQYSHLIFQRNLNLKRYKNFHPSILLNDLNSKSLQRRTFRTRFNNFFSFKYSKEYQNFGLKKIYLNYSEYSSSFFKQFSSSTATSSKNEKILYERPKGLFSWLILLQILLALGVCVLTWKKNKPERKVI